MVLPLRVSDYMIPEVVVVFPNDTLARARNLLLHHGISRLVVVDESSRPVGILTETDVALAVLEESGRKSSRPIDMILVKEVMSSPFTSIGPRTYLKNAALALIKGGFSGLPVVESNGRLLGIITKTDISRAYAEHYRDLLPVSKVMSSPVITVNPMHSIYRVGKLLREYNISRVVVVDGKTPIGVVTKTDLTFMSIDYRPKRIKFEDIARGDSSRRVIRTFRVPVVADIMTQNPLTVDLDEDSAEASAIMIENKISGLPVVDSANNLVGIITKTDLVKALSSLPAR